MAKDMKEKNFNFGETMVAVFDSSYYTRSEIESASNNKVKALLKADDCFACGYTLKDYQHFVNGNSECFADCFIRFYYE